MDLLSTLQEKLLSFQDKPIWLAYSGGVDSQVLLFALSQLKKSYPQLNVSACHVNHGLSQFAQEWQEFAKKSCQQYGIPFHSQKVALAKGTRQSLEAIARDARYNALEVLAPLNAIILTAHHQDDQVETFLLALKRGAGLTGLSAMSEQMAFGHKQQQLFRPLLSVSKAEIIAFAKANELDWVEDDSNADTQFDRNFLRQEILPLLSERWPGFAKAVSRSAGHCRDGEALIDDFLENQYLACWVSESRLNVSVLTMLSPRVFNQVIRRFLSENNKIMPSLAQLEELYSQLKAKKGQAQVKLGEVWLRESSSYLQLTTEFKDVSEWQFSINLNDLAHETDISVELPDGLGIVLFSTGEQPVKLESRVIGKPLRFRLSNKQVMLSFKADNPKCLPDYRQKSRALKKVFQELGIPSWQRVRTPKIYADDMFAGVAGYFVCQPFVEGENKDTVNVYWLENTESG